MKYNNIGKTTKLAQRSKFYFYSWRDMEGNSAIWVEKPASDLQNYINERNRMKIYLAFSTVV